VLAPEFARQVTAMMEGTVAEGTGRRASVTGYRLAGKSGTAQKVVAGAYSESEYVASFGGLAPVTRPRLVALVVLDTPRGPLHRGGQVAAPVFGRIMADALRALRVPPDAGEPMLALWRPTKDAAR
jgi:cell division protein FtsI/penicillin-binding protein 2